MDWPGSGYGKVAGCRGHCALPSGFTKCGKFLHLLRNYWGFVEGLFSMDLYTLKKKQSVWNVTNFFIAFYEIITVWPGNIKSHMNALFRTI
jgi:hypothetical protein